MRQIATALRLAAALLAASLLAAAPAAAQPARDPSFEIVNQSGRVVFQVFATAVTQRDWGRDHLGAATLRQGQSFQVRLPAEGGCLTDVRVVFQGGASLELRRVDTCAQRRLVVEANQIVAAAPAEGPGQPPGQPPAGGKTAGGAPPAPAPAPQQGGE
ncbi:MAG: hypothetical protein NZM27_10475, partial [Acetobacteraceae bacterium]|nr:hypothetical protein [Acetobacteraceae bacterium]